MKPLIYLNGCSFVKGSELAGRDDTDRQYFGKTVAQHFGREHINRAKVGGSNDRIARTTPIHVETYSPELVIIMWTFINRFEYMRNTTWQGVQWNLRHPHRYDLITKDVLNSSQTTRHPNDTDTDWLVKNGWAKRFTNAYGDILRSLNYMYLTKHYLESKGIPYLFYMASSGNIKPFMYLCDETYFEAANSVWPTEQLPASFYYRELPFLKEKGFLEICKSKGLPMGVKNHPLQEGHDLFAEKVIKDIEALKIYD